MKQTTCTDKKAQESKEDEDEQYHCRYRKNSS